MWDDRADRHDRRDDSPEARESSGGYPQRSVRAGHAPTRVPPPRSPVPQPPFRDGHSNQHGSHGTWRAAASAGMLVGALLIAISLALALFAGWQFRGADGSARIVWMLLLLGAVAAGGAVGYLLHGLTTIRYLLEPDRLVVRWLREEQTVHFAEIVDTVYDPREPVRLPGWEPFWPGYHVSTKRTAAGLWRSIATEEPRRRVRVITTRGIVAISPTRPVRFIVELDRMRAMAGVDAPSRHVDAAYYPHPSPDREPDEWQMMPRSGQVDQRRLPRESRHVVARRPATLDVTELDERGWDVANDSHDGSSFDLDTRQDDASESQPASEQRRDTIARPRQRREQVASGSIRHIYEQLFRQQLLGDRVASNLIATGVAIPLLMAAYLFSQYEGVPNPVPLHWDALGDVDRVGEPGALWLLPIMGAIVLIVNTVAATLLMAVDRFLARLILLAVPIVQIVAFIALVRLVTV